MDEIEKEIKQFGDQKNRKALQDYISNININQLTSFLTDRICLRNGLLLWNYILQSFDDSSESHQKRFELSLNVLKIMDKHEIVTRLLLEFPKFKTNHLISICDFCIERIQKGNVLHTSWKDLLPELLNILVEKNCVLVNNVEVSSLEYKNQIINSLCMINWSPNIVTSLAAMFKDVPLRKEEHLQIVNKLSQYIDKLTSRDLPAFTYQLLKLCSSQNSRCVFLRLQYYFSNRIYNNSGNDLDPSSDTIDLDKICDASEYDSLQVESAVLYHIHNFAILGHGSIKEYINLSKNMVEAPEVVLHPFQLTVLLTVSTVPPLKEQTLEIIRGCIDRVITEEIMKEDSAWFRNSVVASVKASNVVSAVLKNSLKERQLVVCGLINLGFVLLNADAALGQKNVAEAQWQLGTFILLKLMKKKREVSSTVIQQLCNRIVTGQNVPHLTECLYQMCQSQTLTMIENEGIVKQLIERIFHLPVESFRLIIDAVISLGNVSPTIRNNLILLLRRALYSRKIEIQQMAVSGFLKLLKNLRISNLVALSQAGLSNSKYSLLTQLSLDCQAQPSVNSFSNEAVCLEVFNILRRCFIQQAEVREELYEGLYDSVCMNSELGIPVLNMLWNHFNQFYNSDVDALPPILFRNIVSTKIVDVVLLEPLGRLIFAIGLILTKVKETHDHPNPIIIRFTDILDSLCERMAKCELIHFDLDSGRDLLDILPECQSDLLILKQAMSVYEALMGYMICSWGPNSENMAKNIYSLFQAYHRLVDLSKNLNKPEKVETSKKPKEDTCNKTTNQKSKSFKALPTILDFQTAGKLLNLLHEPTVSWAIVAQTSMLKVEREFHHYVLNVIIQLFQNIKITNCAETIHTKPYFSYCTEIAAVLCERVMKRLHYVLDFDSTTALLAIECFHNILSLVDLYYKEKMINFLTVIDSKNKHEDLGEHLMPFIENLQNFFEKEDDKYSNDPEGKKLSYLLVNIYTMLVMNLPNYGPHSLKVLDWLKQFTNNNTVSNEQVGNALMSLLFNLNIRCKTETDLYENITNRLCKVIGTINHDKPECSVNLKIINEATALPTLNSIVNLLKLMLNEADWLIQRCRAEDAMISYPGGEQIERRKELLKSKETDLCCHLCRIINICKMVSNVAVPPSVNSEIIFKILMHLYNTLNSLTKYFILISSDINPAFQTAKFERVLKSSGTPLSNTVFAFILYVEESLPSDEESSQQSGNPNTMKTRMIPKLVYEMEQFGRNVITLSNKCKIDLSKYVEIGVILESRQRS